MKHALLLLLLVVILISGCTTGSVIDDDPRPVQKKKLGPYLPEATPKLEPITKQLEDPCIGVVCKPSVLECPDNQAECENSCSDGSCSECKPVCPCKERWICESWGSCSDGRQSRSCFDKSECGTSENKPLSSRDCHSEMRVRITDIDARAEIVTIRNSGSQEASMGGWTLRDLIERKSHVFTFPEGFSLKPSSEVRVHKGSGPSSDKDLYWNNNLNIWNNDHDTAFLKDSNGELIDEFEY